MRDSTLLAALNELIKNHRSLGYTAARQAMFTSINVRAGKVECVYTGRQVNPDGTSTPGGFNTEHSWPQSEGAASEPARSDLHALFPSDSAANSARSNYPFGETSCSDGPTNRCSWSGGGSELGIETGGASRVFEVRPVRRGDIARAHFYFSVRYRLPIPQSEERYLRSWHQQDPPDELELERNGAIEKYQRNRNPFVDRPDFVEHIGDF